MYKTDIDRYEKLRLFKIRCFYRRYVPLRKKYISLCSENIKIKKNNAVWQEKYYEIFDAIKKLNRYSSILPPEVLESHNVLSKVIIEGPLPSTITNETIPLDTYQLHCEMLDWAKFYVSENNGIYEAIHFFIRTSDNEFAYQFTQKGFQSLTKDRLIKMISEQFAVAWQKYQRKKERE